MSKRTFLFILGTRPEAIKLAPLFLYFKKQNDFNVYLLNTQQQKQLSTQTLKYFGIKADFNFSVMSKNQSLFCLNAKLLKRFSAFFAKHKFDAVFVQGDTMSAYVGALSAYYSKIPIFHIEAGLRSKNLYEPFPEEAMRLMISRIATLHFCPTQSDGDNLIKENIPKQSIFISQNTVIDAMDYIDKKENHKSQKRLQSLGLNLSKDKICLVTIHRRENHSKIDELGEAIHTLAKKHKDITFLLPLHPNPNVRFALTNVLKNQSNIILCEPLNYVDLINVLRKSVLVLSDSGGLQEEAPSFGVKVLVLRNFTERVAGLELGFSELVGTDKKRIIARGDYFLNNPCVIRAKNPYGDSKASRRIHNTIKDYFKVEK